ncbi:hypothetical protein C8J57DRAFT_1223458 [Mycena rebaudengoi]|nr:hypothetical protein C8J57DRAFT_1223458 [Mycena rebaudengoi]
MFANVTISRVDFRLKTTKVPNGTVRISCTITGRKISVRIFVPEYWYPGVFWEVNQAPLLQILANAAGILGGWISMQFGIIDRANKRWLQYTLCFAGITIYAPIIFHGTRHKGRI